MPRLQDEDTVGFPPRSEPQVLVVQVGQKNSPEEAQVQGDDLDCNETSELIRISDRFPSDKGSTARIIRMRKKWTDDMTVEFIRLRMKFKHLFEDLRTRKVEAWKTVAANMSPPLPAYTCRRKWDSLVNQYKVVKEALGSSWPELGPRSWQHFSSVREIVESEGYRPDTPEPEVPDGPGKRKASPGGGSSGSSTPDSPPPDRRGVDAVSNKLVKMFEKEDAKDRELTRVIKGLLENLQK